MRASQRLCCVAVLGVCLVGPSSAQQTAQWQPTLDVAKRVAGQTGRLVLIHFWDDGCRPCQIMDRDVFSRADIAAAIDRDFVAVKVNRSHFPASTSQYGVSAVPADVIITPQGQMIERHVGGVAAAEYMSRLTQIASTWRRSSAIPRYAQNPAPQGPAEPSFNARPPQQVAGGVPYARQPAVTGPANGFAARANQRQVPAGPPSMVGRYPADGATAADQNRQFAPRQPEPPASNYGREAFQPVESAYSPPLAGNAGAPLRSDPVQAPYPPQQPPYTGPQTSASVGDFAPNDRESQLAQRRPSPYESNRQPAPVDEPAIGIPAGNPPVALDGFCPVQLTEKKRWVLGNRRWGLRHEGRTYLFAGPDEQRRFNENPDAYAPVMSGNDVVLLVNGGQTAAGRRECGAWFMGRMFLFSDETSFQRFQENPDYYAAAVKESVSNVANRNAGPPTSGRPWNAPN